jgi:hypothetical protein
MVRRPPHFTLHLRLKADVITAACAAARTCEAAVLCTHERLGEDAGLGLAFAKRLFHAPSHRRIHQGTVGGRFVAFTLPKVSSDSYMLLTSRSPCSNPEGFPILRGQAEGGIVVCAECAGMCGVANL